MRAAVWPTIRLARTLQPVPTVGKNSSVPALDRGHTPIAVVNVVLYSFEAAAARADLRGFRLFIFNALLVHTVAADWINSARAPRSSRHLERYSLASDLANLCLLLQQNQDAPVTGQRCPSRSPCSVDRKYRITRNPRRASSPLCSGLGFRYTHGTRTHDLGFCNAKVDASEGPK
jgi:hypothetical protein